MCLYEAKKLNQTEDIICYKVLFKGGWVDSDPFNEHVLFSPFYYSLYRIGNSKYTYCQDNVVNGHYYDGKKVTNCKCLNEALHSLKNKEEAIDYAKSLSANFPKVYVIKCIIPKTSKFLYDGFCLVNDKKFQSYASQKIKPIAIIDCFEQKHNTVQNEM